MRQRHFGFVVGGCALVSAMAGCPDDTLTRVAPKIEVAACAGSDFISDCALDFGEVPISFTRPLDILIKDPTAIDLNISKVDFAPGSDPAFRLPEPVLSRVPSGSDGARLTVTFVPAVESQVNATLRIYSDAANLGADEPVEVLLTGSGKDLGQPDISIEPGACAFGDVGINATGFCDLTIKNEGQLDLVISAVGFEEGTDTAVFEPASVFPLPVYLPAEASVTVKMAATPTATQQYTGVLFFESNDPDTPHATVDLSCTGAAVPTAVACVKTINNQTVACDAPQVAPLDDIVLTGEDSSATNGRTIDAYHWDIVSKPPDSTVVLTTPDARETSFQFNSSGVFRRGLDVAGTFVVRLVVTDSAGLDSTNDARVALSSVPGEDMVVQLTWDHESADMDLHLVRDGGATFTDNDCYFSNCKGSSGLNWGGGAVNPHLDVDDTDGFGPENINIARPNNGTYRVGVHYYAPHSSHVATAVNVKIFVRGGLWAEYTRDMTVCNQYWEVADIEWPSSLVTAINTVRMDSHGYCL